MKSNITKDVEQCKKCHKFYVEGLEGDDGICDACFDEQQDVSETDEDLQVDTEKPNVFTEGDCI